MVKSLQYFVIILLWIGCHLARSQDASTLLEKKESYDSMRQINKTKQLIFVRTTNNDLIKIADGQWPNDIAYTYNILSISNRIILLGIYPFSDSGDWSRAHEYYFDELGKTFAYSHKLNSFNSECTDVLRQNTTIVYDQHFQEVLNKYRVTDKYDINIEIENCIFNYPYENEPYADLNELKLKENLSSL